MDRTELRKYDMNDMAAVITGTGFVVIDRTA